MQSQGSARRLSERSKKSGFRSMAVPESDDGPRLAPGLVVADRFRILRHIGEGGMGEVYLAEQIAMERKVALKVVKSALASDGQMQERFRREALAASRINSRHVVTVHDFGADAAAGRLFIAMEFLEGETLAERLERGGALPAAEVIRIGAQVCMALEAAHAAGVVHRDLKPENVFLERDGNVKVLDFGIARIIDPGQEGGGSHTTMTAMVVGTPAYISPEAAARNKANPVGPQSDLYSLGAMLFELLTGRPPFDDPEPVILIGLHLRAPPERVADVIGAGLVPEELDALIDELLAKRPIERPQGARAVRERLEAASESLVATIARPLKGSSPALDAMADEPTLVSKGGPVVATTAPHPRELPPSIPTASAAAPARASGSRGVVLGGLAIGLLLLGLLASSFVGTGPSGAPIEPAATAAVPAGPAPTSPAIDSEPAVLEGPGALAPAALAPAVVVPAPALPGPSVIAVHFEVSPSSAHLEIDGVPIEEREVVMPADGAVHRAVARIGARRSPTVEFVADDDQHISLAVGRSARPAPTSSSDERPSPAPNDGLLGLIRPEE